MALWDRGTGLTIIKGRNIHKFSWKEVGFSVSWVATLFLVSCGVLQICNGTGWCVIYYGNELSGHPSVNFSPSVNAFKSGLHGTGLVSALSCKRCLYIGLISFAQHFASHNSSARPVYGELNKFLIFVIYASSKLFNISKSQESSMTFLVPMFTVLIYN